MSLAVAKTFLTDLGRLPRPVHDQVATLLRDLRERPDTGLHCEVYGDTAEPSMRAIRVGEFWRALMVEPDFADSRVLLRLLPREEAACWAQRAVCRLHPLTGAFELIDHASIADLTDGRVETGENSRLFSHLRPGDLTAVGIEELVQGQLARISTESELEALSVFLPQDQADALHLFAGGALAEEVSAMLAARRDAAAENLALTEAGTLDHPSSRASFWTIEEAQNLGEALAGPLAVWRIFLHPDQRSLAEAGRFDAPVRVTGAAGTGKTVVALHRTRHLARQLAPGEQILLTCASQPIAHALEAGLRALEALDARDHDLRKKVVISTADRLASQICQQAEVQPVRSLSAPAEGRLWREVVSAEADIHEASKLRDEWERVVLGEDIQTQGEYVSRGTLGAEITNVDERRRVRSEAWHLFENAVAILAEQGLRHRFEIARDAALHLDAASTDRMYRHVIVDEAQDLHPTHWRLLRAAVPFDADDLFIVGDLNQQLHDHRSDLGHFGIDLLGRTHHLDLNYRTSREIMQQADGVLTGRENSAPSCRSVFSGPEPTLVGYNDADREVTELVQTIQAWTADGVDVASIGVVARTAESFGQLSAALAIAAIPAIVHRPGSTSSGGRHITIGTMSELKGLEFSHLAIIDFGAERIPLPWAISSAVVDPARHRRDLQRERNLAYVACTRAREVLRISWTGEPSRILPGDTVR